MTRYLALIGLGFGDCGKGQFTAGLTDYLSAHTVVRFNGGAQAGHNVVRPDGRHHTFSQFGAGSFSDNVATVLAAPVVVHPGALLIEAAALRQVGVCDALDRLLVDARCRINTPFHQAAGRLREIRRGAAAHGSCGVGFGAAVQHSLEHADEALRYGELARSALAMLKLESMRRRFAAEFSDLAPALAAQPAVRAELDVLADPSVAERWLLQIDALVAQVEAVPPERIAERLALPGTVLFEGAQGVLLDECFGFHPHTTWSHVHPDAAREVLADLGLTARLETLGILRSYLTRHGQGPLPTEDPALDLLDEPHNHAGGWQGRFRRGQPDFVLFDYALQVVGTLDGLLVSHLDALDRAGLHGCSAYEVPGKGRLLRLPLGHKGDSEHQSLLTGWLMQARPIYDSKHSLSPIDLLKKLEAMAGCRVLATSHGPRTDRIDYFF